jgi:hypothetical protein
MAGLRQLGFMRPRPKAKASGPKMLGTTPLPRPTGGKAYKKPSIDGDPMKFGAFGYDLNMRRVGGAR